MTSELERKTEAANKAIDELNAEIEREIGRSFLNAAGSQQIQEPPQEQISFVGCVAVFLVTIAVIAVAGWWIWKQLF